MSLNGQLARLSVPPRGLLCATSVPFTNCVHACILDGLPTTSVVCLWLIQVATSLEGKEVGKEAALDDVMPPEF